MGLNKNVIFFVPLVFLLSNVAVASEQKGGADMLDLAKKNNCMTCHSVDKKIVGPSYQDVANKYANDKKAADALLVKVRDGGKGVWGTVPMPPNKQVKDDDIKRLVAWILTQKK